MRERGITVHASDIVYRGCPDSTVLDFLKMTRSAAGLRRAAVKSAVQPIAMEMIEHAFVPRATRAVTREWCERW